MGLFSIFESAPWKGELAAAKEVRSLSRLRGRAGVGVSRQLSCGE